MGKDLERQVLEGPKTKRAWAWLLAWAAGSQHQAGDQACRDLWWQLANMVLPGRNMQAVPDVPLGLVDRGPYSHATEGPPPLQIQLPGRSQFTGPEPLSPGTAGPPGPQGPGRVQGKPRAWPLSSQVVKPEARQLRWEGLACTAASEAAAGPGKQPRVVARSVGSQAPLQTLPQMELLQIKATCGLCRCGPSCLPATKPVAVCVHLRGRAAHPQGPACGLVTSPVLQYMPAPGAAPWATCVDGTWTTPQT